MIPKKYEGREFIMFATGPSLTEEVIEQIRPHKDRFVMFGINDSYRLVDYLDEHYACDGKWWRQWGADFREKYPTLSSWTYEGAKEFAEKHNLNTTRGQHKKQFSLDPNLIHYGANSGYQALNIAYLMGGSKFYLVGYNMQPVGKKGHFFGNHPPGLNSNSPYKLFRDNYNTIQPEISKLIINCTPNSALECFEKANLEDILNA